MTDPSREPQEPTANGQSPSAAEAINQWLSIVTSRIKSLQETQARAQRQARLIALAIVAQIAVFLTVGYFAVVSNFAGDIVRQEFSKAAKMKWTQAKTRFRLVREEVVAEWVDLAMDRLDERGSRLADEVGVELVQFGETYPTRLQQQMRWRFTEALNASVLDIGTNLDEVADILNPDSRTQVLKAVGERLNEKNTSTLNFLVGEYLARDTKDLGDAISRFRSLRPPKSNRGLSDDKRLIHLLLAWLDEAIITRERKE